MARMQKIEWATAFQALWLIRSTVYPNERTLPPALERE
ncbi:hypothetical protein CRENPOLYSF1_430024 [Crenothrix polyspora]|uniref:Uncharacterized protein n=1 Tax=Crenothrix polyspora TaxID=360316 RepID=A0A1R4HAS0_9GAMM|nr:hypothetical protein CRENPOLYSF1_430024 [Crenothrix polyspora]